LGFSDVRENLANGTDGAQELEFLDRIAKHSLCLNSRHLKATLAKDRDGFTKLSLLPSTRKRLDLIDEERNSLVVTPQQVFSEVSATFAIDLD
jgi:hypothetical protein